MTISDRLKEANIPETKQMPVHGPVRQRHEEMKAMHSLNMATGFDLMADFIDSLFEKHAKLIEEAHSRITAAARATRENDEALDKKISDLADRLKQGEKRIRLDEIDRINRHIRSIYSSLHVSSYVREVVNTFDGYVEQRRREIEEGT